MSQSKLAILKIKMLRVYNKNISQEELILTDHAKSLTFLESKAKWALGCITTNKVSRDDGIPAELFQIIKDWLNKGQKWSGPNRSRR